MCGIAGFNAKKGKKADFNVIKILGILNEERGKDSAGIVINNAILKKGNKTTFRELTENHIFPAKIIGNVMVHTRAATVGALTEENAHPYYYKDEGKDGMFFMHNGTVTNIDDLVKKYKVNVTGYQTDSRKLGALIYNGHFDVLSEYLGAAAVCYYYESDPDTIYLFNGAAFEVNENKWVPERDLYYVIINDTMYFSSQKNHLKNALNSPEGITQCPLNQLLKFSNGKLVSFTSYPRKNRFMGYNAKSVDYYVDTTPKVYGGSAWNSNSKQIGFHHSYTNTWVFNMSHHNSLTLLKYATKYFLCEFYMKTYFNDNIAANHVYFNGWQYIDSNTKKPADGQYCLHKDLGKISSGVTGSNYLYYYFYEGILLDGAKSYEKIQDMCKGTSYVTAQTKTDFAYANSHPDTLYLTASSGNFKSRYNKYEIDNLSINDVMWLPFSPFIFLMEKSKITGFLINKSYESFFIDEEIVKKINERSKTATDLKFLGKFFTMNDYKNHCIDSTINHETFSEIVKYERSVSNTKSQSKQTSLESSWEDLDDDFTEMFPVGYNPKPPVLETKEEDDDKPLIISNVDTYSAADMDSKEDTYDDDDIEDLPTVFADFHSSFDMLLAEAADRLEEIEKREGSTPEIEIFKELLVNLEASVVMTLNSSTI